MLVNMRLHSEPFEKIESGKKVVEFRLFDEKRQKLKIGDNLVFTSRDTGKTISTKIINIAVYDDFSETFDKEKDLIKKYYDESKDDFVKAFDEYYSEKLKAGYKVVAIHFEIF